MELNTQRLVYLSGDLVPEKDARISIFDAAVTLGYCVTDSSRTFGHKPFKLEPHIERLYLSLKVARIDPGLTRDQMLQATRDLLDRNLTGKAVVVPD